MSKRPHSAQSSSAMLSGNFQLQRLVKQAKRHAALQQALQQQLAPNAREFCFLASWRNQIVTILITNAMWATRLRFQQTQLLASLQKTPEFMGALRINFKIMPNTDSHLPKKPLLTLSEGAASIIQAGAQTIHDETLRNALERLAERAKKP